MSDYEEEEAQTLVRVVDALDKLDTSSGGLGSLSEDTKKYNTKKWIVEKKAIHEIKKTTHEAGKYGKYDEKELKEKVGLLEKFM